MKLKYQFREVVGRKFEIVGPGVTMYLNMNSTPVETVANIGSALDRAHRAGVDSVRDILVCKVRPNTLCKDKARVCNLPCDCVNCETFKTL